MIRKAALPAVLICFLLPLGAAAQVMIGGGTLRYEPKGAAPVVFNHEKHLAANEHRCSVCHFGVFLMEKGSLKMNMDKMTKGNFCGTCHNGKTAFDVEDRAQCKKCHQ
jgi:c(7)-type cytochrome triheme protein